MMDGFLYPRWVRTFIFGSALRKEAGPPGTMEPVLIPGLQYRSSQGEGTLELREGREKSGAVGMGGTGIENPMVKEGGVKEFLCECPMGKKCLLASKTRS